jgi:hypothetical protein
MITLLSSTEQGKGQCQFFLLEKKIHWNKVSRETSLKEGYKYPGGKFKKSNTYTDKKENLIFLIYKEIQNGAVAKSYITNGLLIYGEIFAHFLIY